MIYRFVENNYREDPVRQLTFSASENIDFFYGIDSHQHSKSIPRKNKRILLTLERSHNYDELEKDFDEIFLIHKYYDVWRSRISSSDTKWKYCYFPIPEKIANMQVNFSEKEYEVAYAGLAFQSNLSSMVLDPIFNFKYAYISMGSSSRITHRNTSYLDKISVLSKSKIAIIHNVIIENPSQSGCPVMRNYIQGNIEKSKQNYAWFDGEKFRHWHPELKSRIFEAAAAGCIPLVLKDDFNSLEDFFEPEKDFLYFENNLAELIQEISSNYEKYSHIAVSAKKKCLQYTDTTFSRDFLFNE